MDADQELHIASALYAGIADTEQWHKALNLAAQAVDTDRCAVLARSVSTDAIMVVDNAGLESDTVDEYEKYYHSVDNVMQAARAVQTGASMLDHRAIDASTIRHSPFYNDFLYRHDIGSLMLTQALREPDMEWTIAFQRSPDRGLFDTEHEQKLQRLTPHLQKSLQLRLRLRELERRACLGSAVLDTFGTPLLFIGSSGRLLLANLAGESWYARHGAELGRSAQWARVLAVATGGIGPAMAEGLRLADGSHIVALPAPPAYRSTHGEGLALVLVHTHLNATPPAKSMLKSLFGLSTAEYRLLEVLMTGSTLPQAARHLGIALETVRSQSKALLQKTGTPRQASLMLLVSALENPMPAK
ncbi:helix-turn-helix transcriptional regulator [Bordetella avium]|uniref:Transcriptional regulator n=1 Tax=Bordetella avium (strain 197N) TaxID=360910 RepID=Q2L1Y2_BORA1|nr:hypothetical protein [Bordetella avium]AZY47757.1 transcriptional regulator [Bordetella avium]AZY51126.1 transcriptional regulator [Bordetella avium]RIQ15017.1 transcriptional regulator [Bordetella avium]RIQ18492.1 transcriptional regulator [Bordetella avium]RIQ35472.1 transcriptional regulator [Bordetella avium]